jgi:hypothetical protein
MSPSADDPTQAASQPDVHSAGNSGELPTIGLDPPSTPGARTLPLPMGSDTTVVKNQRLPASRKLRDFGDYELLEEIGRGGMGVIFKARQVGLDRTVAVKMILAGQLAGEEHVRRFRAEALAAASLQHPNIVTIHEVGEHDGQHFFSMDYVRGHSLAEVVRSGPLPVETAVRYMIAIAEAMRHVHAQQMLHRDLKPSNVLIDEFDQPRLTDFGLARRLAADSKLTATGTVLGTPSYMPPEQAAARRGEVGPASDVYSLGAILYELLTGRPPFQGETPLDTLLAVLDLEPTPPRQINPEVPPELEMICLKCLRKHPSDRYPSAGALADDLRRFQAGHSIEARSQLVPSQLVGRAVDAGANGWALWSLGFGVAGFTLAMATGMVPCAGLMLAGLPAFLAICLGTMGRNRAKAGARHGGKALAGLTCGVVALLLTLVLQVVGGAGALDWMVERGQGLFQREMDWNGLAQRWRPPPADAAEDQLFPATIAIKDRAELRRTAVEPVDSVADPPVQKSGRRATYPSPEGSIDLFVFRANELEKEALFNRVKESLRSDTDNFDNQDRTPPGLSVNYGSGSNAVSRWSFSAADGGPAIFWWGGDWLFLARSANAVDLDGFMRHYLRVVSVPLSGPAAAPPTP